MFLDKYVIDRLFICFEKIRMSKINHKEDISWSKLFDLHLEAHT